MLRIEYNITHRKEIIHGILYLPEERNIFPLVIRLNGMPGYSPEKEEDRFAEIIVNKGFALYAFDYVGVRRSSGYFDYYNCIDNINKVLTELSHHPAIDPSRIALIGESFGGAMAISQCARDNRIKCLILRSPVYDTEEISRLSSFDALTKIWTNKRQMRFPQGNLKELYEKQTECYNPKNLAKRIRCPVKLIAGDKDEILPSSSFKQLYRNIPSDKRKGFHLVNGADHNFTRTKHFETIKDEITDFLADSL